jgi:hypothetical protein
MSYRTSILVFVLSLAVSPAAFTQAPQQQPPAAAQPEDPLSPLAVPKDYHYNARGRRDPFVNPVPKPVVKAAAPPSVAVRPPGLKGVLVEEAKVIGIVVSQEPSMNVVTILAPGGQRFFARPGDALYDARLKSFTAESVTFEITAPGVDPKAAREVVRKMHGDEK